MAASAAGWRPGSPAAGPRRRPLEALAALGVVAFIHVAAAYGLWTHRLLAAHAEVRMLQVDFVAPTVTPPRDPPPAEPHRQQPPGKRETPRQRPPPRQALLVTPPRASAAAVVAATAEQLPVVVDAPAAVAATTPAAQRGAVALGSELSVVCQHRPAPAYPPLSRRLEETGEVILRVELGEDSSVAAARVERGSGHQRLDDAALAAVRSWRCSVPPGFGGGARAVALQPFRFVLQ